MFSTGGPKKLPKVSFGPVKSGTKKQATAFTVILKKPPSGRGEK
jgi:hypothetical protein